MVSRPNAPPVRAPLQQAPHSLPAQPNSFTAAWFKVFLNKDEGVYRDLIFGGGADSICNSAAMAECYVLPNGAGA